MKRLLLPLFIAILGLYSCGPTVRELTADELDAEKKGIVDVMKHYYEASEEKNFAKLVETLASEIYFFGTDSAEVIKEFPEFKTKMMNQWNMFDKMKYGEMSDVFIQMDNQATNAFIIHGVPFAITIGDKTVNLFLRVARSLKKEKGRWVIVSGVLSITNNEEQKMLNEMITKKLGSPSQTK
jgi:hypothetical protein